MDKLVSVVMAVRNEERYIVDVLECLERQTYSNIEIVVVDDCSTDGTRAYLRLFKSRRAVKIVDGPGKGLAAALNVGISHAQADFIARQDADDYSAPSRLLEQVRFLESHDDCGYCGSWYVARFGSGQERLYANVTGPTEIGARMLEMNNVLPHTSLMFRRHQLVAVGGYDEEFRKSEDYDLHLRMLSVARPGCVPKPLVTVLLRDDSMQRSDGLMLPRKYSLYARVRSAIRNGELVDTYGICSSYVDFDRNVVPGAIDGILRSKVHEAEIFRALRFRKFGAAIKHGFYARSWAGNWLTGRRWLSKTEWSRDFRGPVQAALQHF
jgi:glycosyltransferase involved in cell wall biosynthesis